MGLIWQYLQSNYLENDNNLYLHLAQTLFLSG